VGKLNRMMANFGAMHFEGTLDDEKISPFMGYQLKPGHLGSYRATKLNPI
jgi:hypothetical protein